MGPASAVPDAAGLRFHSICRSAYACAHGFGNPPPEYLAMLRGMTGAQKLRRAFQIYWDARRPKTARLRQEHPDWTEEQVQQRVKEIFMNAVT